jgi:E3 ubiquitin-protein ligase RNF115/126
LPCSHRFHDECLREWLRHHSQCPVCRLELRCKGSDMDSVSS